MNGQAKNQYRDLTWEQWNGMHWRERQRVRRFREPPQAPETVQLLLSLSEQKLLSKFAREGKTDLAHYVTTIVRRHVRHKKLQRMKK